MEKPALPVLVTTIGVLGKKRRPSATVAATVNGMVLEVGIEIFRMRRVVKHHGQGADQFTACGEDTQLSEEEWRRQSDS